MIKNVFLIFTFYGFLFSNAQVYYSGNTYGGTGIQNVLSNFKDNAGNVYTVGLYNTAFDFGTENLDSFGGNADGYLAKFDTDGNQVYAQVFGGFMDDAVVAGTSDSAGNVYLTGYFMGAGSNAFDADPGDGVTQLANQSALASRDCFIIKLDPTGVLVWAKQISNPAAAANEDSYDIKVDSQGNVYVAGRFIYADFDPSPDSDALILTPTQGYEGFLVKLDTDGNFQWVRHIQNATNTAKTIAIDNSDNVFVGGEFQGTILVNDGSADHSLISDGNKDGYVYEFDTNGNYINSLSFGGAGVDTVDKMTTTNSGFAFAGTYNGIVDLDPTSGDFTSNGDVNDIYITSMDTSFNYLHSYTLNSPSLNLVKDIIKDDSNNIYVSGIFGDTVDFDNSTADASNTATGTGSNGFVLHISENNEYLDHGIFESTNTVSGVFLENAGNKLCANGSFKDDLDLDPTAGTASVQANGVYTSFISVFQLSTLGVDDIQDNSKFTFYPNPANDFIKIIETNFDAYKIYSLDGKLLQQGMLNSDNIIVLTHLLKGQYILQLSNESEQRSQVFIKN